MVELKFHIVDKQITIDLLRFASPHSKDYLNDKIMHVINEALVNNKTYNSVVVSSDIIDDVTR